MTSPVENSVNFGPTPVGEKPKAKKGGGGCFVWGCLTLIILFAVVVGASYIGLKSVLDKIVAEYGDSTALEIPSVTFAPEQAEAVSKRVSDFFTAVKAGRDTPPLILTAQELNILIDSEDELSILKGHLYFEINDDIINAKYSIPLEPFWYKDRYVNGNTAFKVKVLNNRLQLEIKSLQIKGQSIPEATLKELEQQDIVDKIVSEDPKKAAAISKLKSVVVEGGKITLTANSQAPVDSSTKAPAG